MSRTPVAIRYSKALFNLGSSLEIQEKRLVDLQSFVDAILGDIQVARFFLSPQIPLNNKKNVLKKGFEKSEDSELQNFLMFLLDKSQFGILSQIVEDYRKLVNEKKGVLEAKLITTVVVENSTKESLKEALEKIYKKKITINENVNPQLIGGGIIVVNNQQLDFSIQGKLEKLKEDLLSVNVHRRSKE